MYYILIMLSIVPFWAKPSRYMKEAEKAEANLNYKAGAYYYQKCLNKFPDYPGRDSVYLALINLHAKWGKDSLLLSTIETFCEEIPSSMLIPEAIYKKARFFDKELPPPIRIPEFKNGEFTGDTISIVDKRLADPIKAESLYKVIVEKYKKSSFVEKAKERIKYLNEMISLPVGKVYKCEICGNVFKADKILKTKRKNRQKYLEKYSTTEIRKGRCYEHEIVRVPQKQIIVCPKCGKAIKTKVKYISCMRSEIKSVKRTKKVNSESLCSYCASHQPSFGYIPKNNSPNEALRMLQNYRPKGSLTLLQSIESFYESLYGYGRYRTEGWEYATLGDGIYQFTLRITVRRMDGIIEDHDLIWKVNIKNRSIYAVSEKAEEYMK